MVSSNVNHTNSDDNSIYYSDSVYQNQDNNEQNIDDIDPFEEVIIASWRTRALLKGAVPLIDRANLHQNSDASDWGASNAVVTAIAEIENGLIDIKAARNEIIKTIQTYRAPESILKAAIKGSEKSDIFDGRKKNDVDNDLYSLFMEVFEEDSDGKDSDVKKDTSSNTSPNTSPNLNTPSKNVSNNSNITAQRSTTAQRGTGRNYTKKEKESYNVDIMASYVYQDEEQEF
ncbi:DNA-directed RNA polymerase subunit omega [Lyticum sinuosum]|uniref:Uncharacterized protein n=1 Tax=Lyticum sinuosum TaxID=1332059 RepID=A0AAE5AGV0_9RICK|nr:hypothetical protein [Lyticum sinuosum]MDZ5761222.1 hypothetical protein [Lyticum sinuosum]